MIQYVDNDEKDDVSVYHWQEHFSYWQPKVDIIFVYEAALNQTYDRLDNFSHEEEIDALEKNLLLLSEPFIWKGNNSNINGTCITFFDLLNKRHCLWYNIC